MKIKRVQAERNVPCVVGYGAVVVRLSHLCTRDRIATCYIAPLVGPGDSTDRSHKVVTPKFKIIPLQRKRSTIWGVVSMVRRKQPEGKDPAVELRSVAVGCVRGALACDVDGNAWHVWQVWACGAMSGLRTGSRGVAGIGAQRRSRPCVRPYPWHGW